MYSKEEYGIISPEQKTEKIQIINRSWMSIYIESKSEKDLYEKHHMLQFTAK